VAEHFGSARQAAELADSRYLTLVAEVSGQPAGYTQLGPGPAPECVTGPAPMEIIRFCGLALAGQGPRRLMAPPPSTPPQVVARCGWVCGSGTRARSPSAEAPPAEDGTHTFVLGTDHRRDLVARSLD
jgi:hypothetical protein